MKKITKKNKNEFEFFFDRFEKLVIHCHARNKIITFETFMVVIDF